MGVNDLSFNQLSTVLNAINGHATGTVSPAAVTTADFISVAQATLKTGYDPVIQAISQVLGKTIFSIRPYSRKFKGLRVDNQRFGYITRKIQIADKPFENDDRIPLTDGQSVDMYKINKPNALQTNIYGQNVFQKSLTLFRDQLDSAFKGPDEFGEFVSMVMTNASDMIEQAHESLARAALVNFMAGKMVYDVGNVKHVLKDYNDALGLTSTARLTKADILAPENFKSFVQWFYSYVASISSMMTERSAKFHMNVTQFGGTVDPDTGAITGGTDKTVMRHTPYNKQKVYILNEWRYAADARALADTYHDTYLKYADVETPNFWQFINLPDAISATPMCINAAGLNIAPTSGIAVSNIIGCIFDEEALGYTVMNEWSSATPLNARGGYTNMFWHFTDRYWNDFTENGVILVLDDPA